MKLLGDLQKNPTWVGWQFSLAQLLTLSRCLCNDCIYCWTSEGYKQVPFQITKFSLQMESERCNFSAFIVMRLRLKCSPLGWWFSFWCVCILPNHAITVMLNRTEPYVPEGGHEPFIVPVEPERTADEYEDYGADEPAGEHPPHARWRRALPHRPRQWPWPRALAQRGRAAGRCSDSHLQVRRSSGRLTCHVSSGVASSESALFDC